MAEDLAWIKAAVARSEGLKFLEIIGHVAGLLAKKAQEPEALGRFEFVEEGPHALTLVHRGSLALVATGVQPKKVVDKKPNLVA